MSDKSELLREADEAFGELRVAADGLSEEEAARPWLGTWGVREILIHAAGWHRVMIPALERLARGEAPYPPGTYDDFDAWNARFVTGKSGVKTADASAELEASHRAFVAAAARVPDDGWVEGGAAREIFVNCAPGHYREHAAQIRDWRQARA